MCFFLCLFHGYSINYVLMCVMMVFAVGVLFVVVVCVLVIKLLLLLLDLLNGVCCCFGWLLLCSS